MEKLVAFLKFIGLLLLKICFTSLIISILYYLGLDYNNISISKKILLNIFLDLILMIIFFFIYKKDLKKDAIDYKKNFKKYFFLGLKLWSIGLLVMFISNNIIYIFLNNTSVNENIVQQQISTYPIYMIFETVLFAPFTEELIYRKSIRDIISNDYIYIIVSGLLFGFVHTISGLNSLTELLFIIPYGFMGSCFAYLYTKTKNIYTSMIIHVMHNAILLTMSLLPLIIGG